MKKKIISAILAGAMLISVVSCSKAEPTESESSETSETTTEVTETTLDPDSIMGFNMIDNGDFSSKKAAWNIYLEGGQGIVIVNDKGELEYDCSIVGTKQHANQIYYD